MISMPRPTKPTIARFSTVLERWQAVVNRDASADGRFFYSVRTTGAYCRPACPASSPLRKNVRFHATCDEAEKAGYRPCKRCKPTEVRLAKRHSMAVAKACRLIEQAEIANRIGRPSSARAGGTACGANPLALAVPCHRVVHSDGSLSGYRWGVERKRELLRRERTTSTLQPAL
jgi:O-6-methylguanine DNA methyltransferase